VRRAEQNCLALSCTAELFSDSQLGLSFGDIVE